MYHRQHIGSRHCVLSGSGSNSCCSHNDVSAFSVRPPSQMNCRTPRRSFISKIFTTNRTAAGRADEPSILQPHFAQLREQLVRLPQPFGQGAQPELAIEHLAAARQHMPHRHAATHIQIARTELRLPADVRDLRDGAFIDLHRRYIRPQMKMYRLHPHLQLLSMPSERGHGFLRRETELRSDTPGFSGSNSSSRQDADARAPVQFFGLGTRARRISPGESKCTDNLHLERRTLVRRAF